ncbi:MAG: YceI family protein [Acidobacteriaceae bacterium]|jgi:polyisoprenoid-binding protein YceI
MKLATLTSAVLLLAAAPLAMAQTSTWKSDPAHSEVDFTIKHMALSNVHGRFGTVDATLTWDEQDPTKSTVNATIDVTGVDTGVPNRDNDLKGAKFFDVANNPKATFTSTSVTKGGSGLQVNGNLTIKGVTKPVVLDVDGPTGPVTGMNKKLHVGFSATTTLNREDFGIGAGMPVAMLGDDVKLTIELDFVKQ